MQQEYELSEDRYKYMLEEAWRPWCWACGRGNGCRPDWWFAPWLIHRHHVVRNPRKADRRAVILLCPICHGACHGERYADAPGHVPLNLSSQLWLKLKRDGDYYDRVFLRACSLGDLPGARTPPGFYRHEYCMRRSD